MLGLIAASIFLLIALYGYYTSIRISPLEKDIRKNKLDYECFECKSKFSVDEIKCPNCSFITLYGKRKSKFWVILPILGIWIFLLAKFAKRGLI
tara:strand:+ start:2331 stop:2612 length:282 start_codon:yes stop_codon:yes gene_type:complete